MMNCFYFRLITKVALSELLYQFTSHSEGTRAQVTRARAHQGAAGGMNADNRLQCKAVLAKPIAFNKLSSNCYIDGEGLSPSRLLMIGGLLRSSPL